MVSNLLITNSLYIFQDMDQATINIEKFSLNQKHLESRMSKEGETITLFDLDTALDRLEKLLNNKDKVSLINIYL